MRSVRAIAVDKVPGKFDDKCIRELARIVRLPAGADIARFTASVHGAVRAYAKAIRVPSSNDMYREVETLHRAADREQYDELATLLDRLSPATRAWLDERGE